jgi:hypothetical protein
MAEVQKLLSDLESRRDEFERKSPEERAKYEADVSQTRATLAQVRSLRSHGRYQVGVEHSRRDGRRTRQQQLLSAWLPEGHIWCINQGVERVLTMSCMLGPACIAHISVTPTCISTCHSYLQVRSVLPRLLKEAGHLDLKKERSSFRPPGEMSPEPFGPTASGSFDEQELIMMAGVAAVPPHKRSSTSSTGYPGASFSTSSSRQGFFAGQQEFAGAQQAPGAYAYSKQGAEFGGVAVGGVVVGRGSPGAGGAELELNRMQETMDGLQVGCLFCTSSAAGSWASSVPPCCQDF